MSYTVFSDKRKKLVSLKEASELVSSYFDRGISVSNIMYLIQYGRVNKYEEKGRLLVDIEELKNYYKDLDNRRKIWRKVLGESVNWHLSFSQYREAERTKHVHRLHPYKGKFIPQLVEYFLDSHKDEFKREVYFQKGEIVLDPFCGSGTTLVQANELGIHAIGIDVSSFNVLISEVKVGKHNTVLIGNTIRELNRKLKEFQSTRNNIVFEEELLLELTKFNDEYFPSPEYKKKIANKIINEKEYSRAREKEFLAIYNRLIQKYQIKLLQRKKETFLDKWFLCPVREEIDFLAREIKKISNEDVKKVLSIVLSRTVRSCRATTHSDLATLKEPVLTTYYCKKHGKICKPIFSITKWWDFYTKDTLNRLKEFEKLRTDTFQICLTGDSRTIDIHNALNKINPEFAKKLLEHKLLLTQPF